MYIVRADADILTDIYNSAFYDDHIRYGHCPAYGHSRESMEQSILVLVFQRSILICLTTPQHIREGSRYPARISHLWYSYQEGS